MFQEPATVVLNVDIPRFGLTAGDIGTIVMEHAAGPGYIVEFVTLAGKTIAIETLSSAELRPIHADEIAHVRQIATVP